MVGSGISGARADRNSGGLMRKRDHHRQSRRRLCLSIAAEALACRDRHMPVE